MREKLIEAFPSLTKKELSDDYIKEKYNLLWDIPSIPLIRAVPLYMLWCINHSSEEGELVFSDTITALNTYSRVKDSKSKGLNFKHQCTKRQVEVVLLFLYWCETSLLLDYEPVLERAIRNWQTVNIALLT